MWDNKKSKFSSSIFNKKTNNPHNPTFLYFSIMKKLLIIGRYILGATNIER